MDHEALRLSIYFYSFIIIFWFMLLLVFIINKTKKRNTTMIVIFIMAVSPFVLGAIGFFYYLFNRIY